MTSPRIRFEVDRAGLRISMIVLEDLRTGKSDREFEAYEADLFDEIRSLMTLDEVKSDPIFRSYRDLYWTFGMDPTKLRVSSEALLRRVLRGENLWRISNLVDVANLASAYHKIPIGLIDDSKRVGDLVVRTARRGEVFTRIGGKTLECRGREIVLADEEKIVCFGYATHDSEMTKVSKESERVLVLLYGSPAVTGSVLSDAYDRTAYMIDSWVDCRMSKPITFTSSD
ncbi:MAG: B3/B4 domain-containing protein [Candidatus Thorarchaeota archaeon]